MAYMVRGVNDERDFCECCGKVNLKRVVWIENTETGEIKHFGTTCALSPVKGFGVDPEIKRAIRRHDDVIKQRLQTAGWLYRKKYHGKYDYNLKPGRSMVADKALWERCKQEAGL